jgi:hypothetical protein
MVVSRYLGQLLRVWMILALVLAPVSPAHADLRAAPVWWDQNTVGATPDWHYRVPISVPGGATINSTVKVDVDFQALVSTMGVTGTFDVNSPRVVRATGAIAATQEFTDSVYAGATDATGNARGEVRFILQDAGATTYYLYFDITENGAKPVNPQTPINGNFEKGGAGLDSGQQGRSDAGFRNPAQREPDDHVGRRQPDQQPAHDGRDTQHRAVFLYSRRADEQ